MAGILSPLLGASSTAMLGMLIEGTEPPWLSFVSSTQIDGIGVPVEALGIVVLSSATTILGIAMGFFGWAMEEEDLLGVAGSDRPSRTVTDGGGFREVRAAILQAHTRGRADIVTPYFHAILSFHLVVNRDGALAGAVSGV
ncbi:hypothetical protein HG530_012854 [Fusarium avenaceum]|nr:hypothetical protein HG530_012854 [Fusarium avenaceum]